MVTSMMQLAVCYNVTLVEEFYFIPDPKIFHHLSTLRLQMVIFNFINLKVSIITMTKILNK